MFNYGYGYDHGGNGGEFFMILFMILMIAIIIALIKYFMGDSKNTESSKKALDILKERYAKGEIEQEEFETKKKNLM